MLLEIISILLGVLTLAVSYLAVREKIKSNAYKRREREEKEKEKQRKKEEEEMARKLRKELKEDIKEVVDNSLENYESKEEIEKEDRKLWEEIAGLKESLNEHFDESIASEMARLATDIINFADDLRNGIPKSRNAFKHISKSYSRYKKLGGNHYIDAEYAFIKQAMIDESN